MKILVAGDFCPQYRVAEKFEQGDYESVLGGVKEVISSADYSIVNFECPVTRGREKPIEKCGPNLKCTEKGIEAVKWAGFDCVTLANNHFLDFGSEGVENTLRVCKQYGIDTIGGGMNLRAASNTLYKEIGGKMLAIINCCEHEFSIATESTPGSNPLNPVRQYYAIQKAHHKADYVLVIVHGGHEHYQLPSTRMQETYRFFIDAGADAVVNHHQHCYSGYEVYKGKPIFYGLGNFCFDDQTVLEGTWTEGFMTCLSFEDALVSFSKHPYIQCKREARVLLLEEDAYDSRIRELNSIILNESELKKETESFYNVRDEYYNDIFEPIRGRYYLSAKHRKWLPSLISRKRFLEAANFILCESHRDILFHFFLKPRR